MRWLWAFLAMCSACDNTPDTVAPAPELAAAPASAPAAAPAASASAAAETEKAKPAQRRFRDAVVHLDGKPLAVLRHGEMPPTVKPKFLYDDGFPRFRLTDYLAAVGVDVAKIRELHVYGGKRVAIIDGDEVRRTKDVLLFAFNQATRGKPRMEWPEGEIEVSTRVDTISAIAVYQDKAAPQILHSTRGPYLAFEAGKPLDAIPYAPVEKILQGTRAYVDGRFVAAVKRKTIPESFVIPGTSPTRFRLVPYLESLGVDFRGAREVHFVQGDDTLARVSGEAWAAKASKLEFLLGQGSQGHVLVDLGPLRDDGAGRHARLSGVLIFRSITPPTSALLDLGQLGPEEDAGIWDPSVAGEDS